MMYNSVSQRWSAPIEKVMYRYSHTVYAKYNDMKNGLILKIV
jgi:hypothetical protein